MSQPRETAPQERTNLSLKIRIAVLTESGYRCAVPTCRGILAQDIHHIYEVKAGGGSTLSNLIALCPTCHELYHRGTIKRDSIYAWKAMLVSLSQAFDVSTIDDLLFLEKLKPRELSISGDGVLKFSRLIAAGLAQFKQDIHTFVSSGMQQQAQLVYEVELTRKGRMLLEVWKSGDRIRVESFLKAQPPEGSTA